MVLIIHVIVALFNLGYVAYVFFAPTQRKLQVSYALIGLTVGSGSYLVWRTQTHMLQTCTMGLFYLGAMIAATAAAHHKLAKETTTHSD